MTAAKPRVAHRPPTMPSDVTGQPRLFDRFATMVSKFTSRALFFVACLLIVLLWLPSYFLIADTNTWQLIINSLTTIVTFLLVALLQNTQTRAEAAMQQKLNAIADGLADMMAALAGDHPELQKDREELADAVGLELRERS
jgi:low affinity Fe/Cu permease